MERRPHIILSIYEKLGGVVENGREYRDLGTVIDEAVKENRVLSYDKKMRGVLPVTAQHQALGSITDTSLKENIAQFQKEVNNFKQKIRQIIPCETQHIPQQLRAGTQRTHSGWWTRQQRKHLRTARQD